MRKVNVYEAKTRLSQLIEEAASGAHTERLASLPPIHKDPFDRMLVAQSLAETLVLLTNDGALAAYGSVVKIV